MPEQKDNDQSDEAKRTERFKELALRYSRYYKGKVDTFPKVPVRQLNDFSIWYTPGVAAVSLEIAKNRDLSFELTGRWNSIAILTDGTRVLGLGNVGPEAAMAVMEGKALIFNYLGAVNAIPIPVRAQDREQFISVATALEPSFGGFNLEDIESPKCFYIQEKLQKALTIPVWHDDQLGTACITLAGMINSLRVVGKKISDARVVLMGSGAANIATARLIIAAGVRPGNLIMVDSRGVIDNERKDLDGMMVNNPWKYELALATNSDRIRGEAANAFKGADVVLSASRQGPGTIKEEWISSMNRDAVVFALANPVPEIWPREAIGAGARVVATGRSDFPNQINNSLVFPGVFRGALDARASGVNVDIMLAASTQIADFVKEPGPEKIVPTMEEWELYPSVASAVAFRASELGFARKSGSRESFYRTAHEKIEENRKMYRRMLEEKYIRELPGGDVNE